MKRFNWIDITIVVILIAAVAFLGMKMLGGKTETLGAENQLSEPNLRIEVLCEDVTLEVAENVIASLQGAPREMSGMMVEKTRLFNSSNLVAGAITAWVIEPTERENVVNLRLTIEANAVLSKGSYSIGTQEIRIGRGYTAKTMDIELEGSIAVMTELAK